MKLVIVINFLLILLVLLPISQVRASSKQYALIYKGPGSCLGCPEAAARIATSLQLPIQYIEPGNLTAKTFLNAAVYIQPGGDDSLDIKEALSAEEISALKNYVKTGGRYWGICAGAYFAGETLDDEGKVEGLNIIPGDAEPYTRSPMARLELVTWQGQKRQMYLQDAPHFRLLADAKVITIANYNNGSIAAFITDYGKGKVAVCGPHPEADYAWFDKDELPRPTALSQDLAVEMLRELLR